MEFETFKEILESGKLVRPELPGMAQSFCQLLERHGEVQIDLASGKKYSLHLGDTGNICSSCVTVRLFDGRIISVGWEQVENCWIHLANDE